MTGITYEYLSAFSMLNENKPLRISNAVGYASAFVRLLSSQFTILEASCKHYPSEKRFFNLSHLGKLNMSDAQTYSTPHRVSS